MRVISSSSPQKVQFITERLRQGLGRKEILDDYRMMWNDSERTFDRNLKRAKDVLAQEHVELYKHRIDVMKSEQAQTIRTSHETVLRLQSLFDELYNNFFAAKTVKERIDYALAVVKVTSEICHMLGYYSPSKSEVSLDVVPPEKNTIGRYFEMVDERLKEEHARELNDALD